MESSTGVRRSPAQEAWATMRELTMSQRGSMLAAAADLQLSPPQLLALHALEAGEPAPMSALAAALRCDASNVTGIVDRLEDRGLVERRPAPHDRRIKHLVLTEQGEALRREVAERLDEAPAGFDALSAAEARQLGELLKKVASAQPPPA
jgi:DNA-binding MarR family transcriptional regulator